MSRYVDIEPYDDCRIVLNTEDGGFPCADLKTADVHKVKHGKWLPLKFTLECSICGNSFTERNLTIYDQRTDTLAYAYYCPNCGAKMDLEGKS